MPPTALSRVRVAMLSLALVATAVESCAQDAFTDLLTRVAARDSNAVRRDSSGNVCSIDLRGEVPLDPWLSGLRGLTALTQLALAETDLTDAGLAAVSGTPALTELRLSSTRVTDAGLAALAGLRKLGSLHLESTEVTGPGLAHLSGTRVSWLRLDGSPVTDEGLVHLGRIPTLRGLFLNATRVTDAGLASLAGLVGLEFLELRGTAITDAGLAKLAQLSSLKTLNLAGTDVTDVGMAALAALKNLQHLDVRGTAVTPAGLACLGDLPDLRELGVAVEGAGGLAPLAKLTHVKSAYLDLRGVPDAEVSAYYGSGSRSGGMSLQPAISAEELQKQQERLLTLIRSAEASAQGILKVGRARAGAGSDRLHRGGDGEDREDANSRAGNSAEGPQVPAFHLTPAVMDAIAAATKILRLDLGDLPLRDRLVRRLAGMKGLVSLRLTSPYYDTDFGTRNFGSGVSDRGLALLAGMPALEELGLWGTRLAGYALESVEAMPGLRSLDLGYTFISGARLRHLRHCADLRTLNLEHTRTFSSDLASLSGLSRLETLNLAATRVTDAGIPALKGLKSLRALDLRGTKVSLAAVAELKRALPELQVTPAEGAPADHPAPGPRRSDMW